MRDDRDPAALPFLAFAYELGRSRATGTLVAAGEALAVREGAVVAAEVDALGRQAAAALARMAALEPGQWRFRAEAVSGRGKLVPLTEWARRFIERGLDAALCARITAGIGGARLMLRPGRGPDPASLDALDRRLLDALGRPRALPELATLARAPRFRLLALVHFLGSVGALRVLRGGGAREARAAA